MRPETYEIWREEWQKEHPGQNPPTIEQVNTMMKMFGFTAKSLFGLDDD